MKEKLLLHSCCAPCSTAVIEALKDEYLITVIFYNPNIEPEEEYLKRKNEQINYLKKINIPSLDIDYQNEKFRKQSIGLENEPERGQRCHECYALRLIRTAKIAAEEGYKYFSTTLIVSPYKDKEMINGLASNFARRYRVIYVQLDFEKNKGYQRSIELSKEYNLYRQNYCGCLYSKRTEE